MKVKLFTDTPERLRGTACCTDRHGHRFEITAIRPGKDGEAVMSFPASPTAMPPKR